MKLSTAINQATKINAIVIVGDKSCYVKVSRATARDLVDEYLDEISEGDSWYDESGTSISTSIFGAGFKHLYIC